MLIVAAGRTTFLVLGEDSEAIGVAREVLEGIFLADQGMVARQAHSCYQ